MTGTAMTEASEFDKIYGLGVVPIPTNLPMIRKDQADLVYRTEEAKYDAVVEDIAERHAKGQPILVGTVSVEKSEHLSNKLKKLGVAHACSTRRCTPTRPRSSRWPATRARSPSPPTWPAEARTSCSAARWSSSRTTSCASRASTRSGDRRRVRGGLARDARAGQGPGGAPSTTRSATSAASTSSAPSGTSPGASTTSCVAGPAVRATRVSRGSTSPCRTS